MKKYLLPLLLLAAPAFAAQQEITAVPASPANPSIGSLKTAINLRLADIDENFDEIYPIIEAGPVYVNASAPADTKVVWIDTDQSNAIKVYVGGVWTVVGTAGEAYTLPTAAADTLGGIKVGDRLTITDGVLSADVQTGSATYPSAAGVANWGGSAWGTSYTVGTGASNLVQLNGSAQLPAVSADLLTITDTGTYFTTDTVAAALQELGSGLADVTEITLDASLTETGGVLSVTYPVTSETYGSGWSADTDGAQRDDIYAILHAGDTDDDGMADKLDLVAAGYVKVNSSGVISSVKEKEYIGWSVVNSDTATSVADGKLGAAVPAGMNEMNLTDVTCSVAALNAAASGATTAVIRRVRLGSRMGDDTSQFDLTFSTPNVTVTWDSTGTDPGISSSTLAAGDEVDISGFETAANNGHFTVATVGANYITFANASGVENLNDVGVTLTPIRHRDMTSTGVTIEYGDYTASDEVVDTSNDDLATGDKLYVDINAVTSPAQKGLHCTATFEAP